MKRGFFMDKLRNILLQYRQIHNLTQSELAEYLGFSRNNIANWEIGRSKPSVRQYPIIAEKLNVDINLLMGAETENNTDFRIALYNQLGELTDEQAKEVMNYIEYIKSKG